MAKNQEQRSLDLVHTERGVEVSLEIDDGGNVIRLRGSEDALWRTVQTLCAKLGNPIPSNDEAKSLFIEGGSFNELRPGSGVYAVWMNKPGEVIAQVRNARGM